jgi:hypothetical protein
VGRSYRLVRLQQDKSSSEEFMDVEAEAERLDMYPNDPRFPKMAQLKGNALAAADAVQLQRQLGMFHEAISQEVDPLRDRKLWPAGRPPSGTLCQIPGWSVDRCDAARAKLRTWQMDVVWTEAQHRIGGKFGANQCKELPVRRKTPYDYCLTNEQSSGYTSPSGPEGLSSPGGSASGL